MPPSTRIRGERAVRLEFQSRRPTLDELVASGDYTEPMAQRDYLQLAHAVAALRSLRRRAGVSLSGMSKRTGIDKAALSRLENGVADNPTISTLNRYAAALGKTLLLRIADRPRAARTRKAAAAR